MSLRHFKTILAVSCLVASTASVTVLQSSPASLSETSISEDKREVAFRGSGRFSNQLLQAYRASGRFSNGLERYTISYRGSERGIDAVAYRASGRFDRGTWGNSLISKLTEQDKQVVAYRASGRFQSGLEQYQISYRGSERGIAELA